MSYELSVEKTAITNGVSVSCKELVSDYIEGNVLDYGFGKFRNTKYIISNNIELDVLDTIEQIKNNDNNLKDKSIKLIYNSEQHIEKDNYNYILLSFVLNVVPEYKDREFIVQNIHNGLKEDGFLYVEVRNDTFLKTAKTKTEYNDGFVLGSGKKRTFQKPYTLEQIVEFMDKNKFEVLKTKKTSGSIMLKCKKK